MPPRYWLLSNKRVVKEKLLPKSEGNGPLKLLNPKSRISSSFNSPISLGTVPKNELLRRIIDFNSDSCPSSGASIPPRQRSLKFKITTFPSEHSTPNQEQGLTLSPTPSLSPHFDKAPKGSLTTLSRNLNNAIPSLFRHHARLRF